ncbi:MAG: ATP-binding cassette domain-containing protein, partial [Opitutales bacterium]|nr:ATP-binding cassette domain-containing protein [Opitutales bacterium]
MKKILDIQNLSFIKDKEILKSVSWQVEKGERWALLGANGAGKTSLLSVICGYEAPSSGVM